LIGSAGRTTVIKLHGDLDDVERIVITNADYYREPVPGDLRRELEGYLSKHNVLFIGHSLSDGDLQEIYFQVRDRLARMMPTHFTVTPFPAEGSLYRRKWELYRKRWQGRGIEFLDGTAGTFLSQLDQQLRGNPGGGQ
jgi:SIR2-like domain